MVSIIDPNSITLVSFSNGEWVNAEQTIVRGLLQWSIMDEASIGGVDLTEDYPHIQQLKSGIDAGDFGVIAAYVAPTQDETDAELSLYAGYRRRDLLLETDVWALSDRTMTAEQTAYRQALRDITSQAGFPNNITWPQEPSA